MPISAKDTAADIAALLRARNPLIWVVSREEARAESYLFEAAASAGYVARTWDCGQGVADMAGKPVPIGGADPSDTFAAIRSRAESSQERGVWIMRDLTGWLQGPAGMAPTRQLRNLARFLPSVGRSSAQAVIVLSPSADMPAELSNHATVVEFPLPDRGEIAGILDGAIAALPTELQAGAAPNGARDSAIDSAVGLSAEEAAACYAKSLVQLKRIDPVAVAAEKRRVISKDGLLEWCEPLAGGLESVGGLDVLKGWLTTRKAAYSGAARLYGLPAPRGVLLVGISGCGKSLTAKAIAAAWGVPLLRLDMGALKSKFVGESEGNLRRVLRVVESVGRCVLWIDEIEKALAGATQGAADGGVAADALGALLSWMQDRAGEAFIVATSNDISALPPELLRKGRFDELFFVDLPTIAERMEIIGAALRSHGRGNVSIAKGDVAMATSGFTGSEIAALVPDALFAAFADGGREISTADLVDAARNVVPLSKTAATKIESLRTWADGRCRRATTPELQPGVPAASARALDL